MRRELILGSLLASIVLIVYWPARHYGFLCYDDQLFITQNPVVLSGLNWQSLSYAVSASVAENWHPVTILSHIIDCEVWGPNPGRMHLVNVAFHIANTLLLFLVLRRMTGATWRSAAVAGIFALHPLRIESVAWIAERKDVLSGFFFMLTLWAYVRYVEETKAMSHKPELPSEQRHAHAPSRYYALTLLLFVLGLMSKPMLVTLPFILLLLDIWPLNRVSIAATREAVSEDDAARFRGSGQQSPPGILGFPVSTLRDLAWEKWPFFVAAALFCWITLQVQREGISDMGLGDRISNAVAGYVQYIGKTFWPINLAVLYPHPGKHYPLSEQWPGWQVGAAALLLLAVSAFCVRQIRRRPFLAVGWFWYLGTLVPVIGVVQVGQQAMADRYTYIPLIGFTISLVWLLAGNREPGTLRKILLAALTLAALGACLATTRHQLQYWRNSITLFEHAVEVTADNPIAQCNLGGALEVQGNSSAAAVRYRVAIAIEPRNLEAHYNLGRILKGQEKWSEAAEEFLAVTRLRPNLYLPHLALVEILSRSGRAKEAVGQMEEALRILPRLSTASPDKSVLQPTVGMLNNLAWILATDSHPENQDADHAVRFAERACELTKYQNAAIVRTLAASYAAAGRFKEAVSTAEKACILATESGNNSLLQQCQEQLELFGTGRPYREPARAASEILHQTNPRQP